MSQKQMRRHIRNAEIPTGSYCTFLLGSATTTKLLLTN